ncbi:hypothetical protein SDC9_36912 [bioreactor metagenome]|jgi:Predicted ATPase (AAA+ superfamily)|uniref:Uncharacterized protein n=1 Tax=bioreactor metagenome TaxID=1076179 RepID=A0A644VHZ5_9ZZZZ|nr:ATP-binding protein [Acidaminococcaceae bacterium]
MNCYANLNNLMIYRNLLEDPIIQDLRRPKEIFSAELFGRLIDKAEEHGLMGIIPVEYVLHAISHQENVFSLVAEKNSGKVGEGLKKAAAKDIVLLRAFLEDVFNRFKNHNLLGNYKPTVIRMFTGRSILEKCFMDFRYDPSGKEAVKLMCEYYGKYGYGIMADHVAFNWDGEIQALAGIRNYATMTFEDIYGYDTQKEELMRNTEAFLHDKPANNVLLFGDRGTGKSSSIKAVGNEYYADGLRMVQVSREYFVQLPKLMQALSKWGKKFIIVLDDLSFEEFEVEYKVLKSILDGGLEVKPPNVLFYATSNRRNIIKEVWQDQDQSELHNVDSVNEKVSMADRFGIKLYYDSINQAEYFTMLKGIARSESLNIAQEDLEAEAIKWEMSHTGRNGRMARQLIDYLHGK